VVDPVASLCVVDPEEAERLGSVLGAKRVWGQSRESDLNKDEEDRKESAHG